MGMVGQLAQAADRRGGGQPVLQVGLLHVRLQCQHQSVTTQYSQDQFCKTSFGGQVAVDVDCAPITASHLQHGAAAAGLTGRALGRLLSASSPSPDIAGDAAAGMLARDSVADGEPSHPY